MKLPQLILLRLGFLTFFIPCPTLAVSDVVFYGEPYAGIAYNSVHASYGVSSIKDPTYKGAGLTAGMNLGWHSDYVHLLIGGGLDHIFYDPSFRGGLWNLGVGIGWEWNIPLMTTIFIRNSNFYGASDESFSNSNFNSIELGFSYFFSEELKANFSYSSFDQSVSSVGVKSDLFRLSMSFPFAIDYPNEWWRLRRRLGD
ncbi:MAG: hypothetical protein JNM39_08755 [Bdellovibrionaceae bacterium]|nr:hypothetical protein [Pseudobdellovibrionaceae bacterium]